MILNQYYYNIKNGTIILIIIVLILYIYIYVTYNDTVVGVLSAPRPEHLRPVVVAYC